MSNIRLNTIVPDVVNNPSGVISLPGTLSVSSFTTTSLADSNFLGGVGIGKNLSITGNVSFANTASTAAVIAQNTTASADNKGIILAGGGATGATRGASLELYGNQFNSGNLRLSTGSTGTLTITTGTSDAAQFSSTGTLTLLGTSPTTSSSTGALVLSAGGLAIANAQDASSITNGGAATIAGGLAVAKACYIGGLLSTTGNISSAGTISSSSLLDASGTGSGSILHFRWCKRQQSILRRK